MRLFATLAVMATANAFMGEGNFTVKIVEIDKN